MLGQEVCTNLEQIITICGRRQFQSETILSDRLGDGTDVPSHAGLAWDASGDNNDVGAREGLLEAVIRGQVARDFGGGRNVRDISRDTGGVDDIEQAELSAVRNTQRRKFGLGESWIVRNRAERGRTSVTSGFSLRRRERGWPMPPACHPVKVIVHFLVRTVTL